MLNIEIKARYPDLEKGARIAEKLGGSRQGTDIQCDTYYRVRSGRLKLRTSTLSPNYLVGYHRPDQSAAKESNYTIVEIADPENLHTALESTLGTWLVVRKSRTIFLIENVRVHLDEVDELGQFLEFEAVISDGRTPEEGHEQVRQLMKEFGIGESDLIDRSYSDLLQASEAAEPAMSKDSNPHEVALGKIPSGCFIVTASQGAEATGFLASWVQQVSFQPLTLMICVKPDRPIMNTILEEQIFTVNIISDDNKNLLSHFAKGFEPGQNAFQGIDTGVGDNGIPFILECLGHLECKVVSIAEPGDHQVIFGEVISGGLVGGEPYVHVRKTARHY